MTHIRKSLSLSFDVQTAIEYGVDESIMIYNLRHWIEHNIGNKKHNYDGRTWTYNTQEAFTYLFPFWSKKQVWRILNSLEKQGVIIKGNYNQHAYDRTQWYAFKDEEKWVRSFDDSPKTLEDVHIPKREQANFQTGTNKFPNGNKQISKAELANSQTVPTIPNNYQITTNNYNNNETIDLNNHTIHAHELLLSLNFEETVPTPSKALSNEQKERQKEEVVLLPLTGLNERQAKEASKKLAQLSPDQREIAIHSFNQTAERGRIKRPMALIHELVNLGLENKLEPPLNAFNRNSTPTQELKTHSEANNEASNEDYRRETTLEFLKLKVAKYKDKMLAEYKQKRAVFIQGLGVFYQEDLAAAGLFD